MDSVGAVRRPARFEHHRYLGDKRTQLVYDLDSWSDTAVIDALMAAETFLCFAPDTLAEARTRGYRAARAGRAPKVLRRPRG